MVFKWFLNGFLNGLFGLLTVTSRTSKQVDRASCRHGLWLHSNLGRHGPFLDQDGESRPRNVWLILH